MVENKIVIGGFTFTGSDIISLTVTRANSLMLDEMTSDICEATVHSNSDAIDSLEYGTQVSIYRDLAVQDVFYLTKVSRLKKDQYKLEMTSFFGILESELFYGGYYTGQTFQSVVESIIQTNGLNPNTTDHADMLGQIEYDPGVAALTVYGWIKVLSKREALHQVLFSRGISMKRSSGGAIRFSQVYDTEPASIPESRTYEENDVTFLPSVSDIEVEEHTYTDDIDLPLSVLFENRQATEAGRTYVAVFNCDSPVLRNVQTSGLTILYQNCNAAVVTGMGSISGYPSVHSTTMIKEKIRLTAGDTVSFTGNTMITIANSAFIMDRLKSYYLSAETEVTTDIVRGDERTGSHVSVVNSFGERVSGFITHMTETYSGIVKAECKIVTGYHPVTPLDGYSHSAVLFGSGGWVVPESVYLKPTPKVKVVLVGGGTGGDSGHAGGPGDKGSPRELGYGGAGGFGGNGGTGGKIYEVEITNPDATLSYSCGSGGSGGAATTSHTTSNTGSAGGNTTITSGGTTYSSSPGTRSDRGVTNFLTGVQYGLSNVDSRISTIWKYKSAGGDGGFGTGQGGTGSSGREASAYTFDLQGNSYGETSYDGGQPGNSATGRWFYTGAQSPYVDGEGKGGGGGGAAAGNPGAKGGSASGEWAQKYDVAVYGGTGANGSDATLIPPKPSAIKPTGFLPWDDGGWGDGGFGGYGGGGGGSGGDTIWFYYDDLTGFVAGEGGSGGKGGQGGSGGDGCIIVYY